MITKGSFVRAIHSLFPKRFIDSDINQLWSRVASKGTISNKLFSLLFGKQQSAYEQPQREVSPEQYVTLLDRVRRFLRNSNLNLAEMFAAYHPEHVTNLEFRTVLRSLNMGLTFQEIDQLCSICTIDQNSMINWHEFTKMLKLRQADKKILDRATIHMSNINDHIYYYLISPKDAFRTFDSQHQGHLSFEQFRNLIDQLYRLAGEEVPPFAIIKDLFEFIDKRRDGLLDLTEWMDAFSKYKNPNEGRPMSAGPRNRSRPMKRNTLSEK